MTATDVANEEAEADREIKRARSELQVAQSTHTTLAHSTFSLAFLSACLLACLPTYHSLRLLLRAGDDP